MCRVPVVFVVVLLTTLVSGKRMLAIPATQEFVRFSDNSADQDTGFNSKTTIPRPHVKHENVVFDAAMPHPDSGKQMGEGPDRVLVPAAPQVEEHEGPTHTTHRNMVIEGDSMVTMDADTNFGQRATRSALEKLEALDSSDMPRSPESDQGADCTDEASVLRVGTDPAFSTTPVLPTKETRAPFGVPEVNSYHDFAAGMTREQRVTDSDINRIVKSSTEDETSHRPQLPILTPFDETSLELPYKFTSKLQFTCPTDVSDLLTTTYNKVIREAIGLGAHVPMGNVVLGTVTHESVLSFDVGAKTLADVRTEVFLLRTYVKSGAFMERAVLRGFPAGCGLTVISLGDGLDDDGIMPEASAQQQSGPPGGRDETPLTIDEQRLRVQAREAMTYGEYSRPGRFNLTSLSPHIFGNGQAGPAGYHVVGRLAFLVPEGPHAENFAGSYSELISHAVADIAGKPSKLVYLSVDGTPQRKLHTVDQALVQAQAIRTVLVDFDIPTEDLPDAHQVMEGVVTGMANSKAGFSHYLLSDSSYPGFQHSLLFIEIHSPDGQVIEGDEAAANQISADCTDEEEDDEIETPEPVPEAKLNVECDEVEPKTVKDLDVAVDPSTIAAVPVRPKGDQWPAMATKPRNPNLMNRPAYQPLVGRDGQEVQPQTVPDPTTFGSATNMPLPGPTANNNGQPGEPDVDCAESQIDSATTGESETVPAVALISDMPVVNSPAVNAPTKHVVADEALGLSMLNQLDVHSKPSVSAMQLSVNEQLAASGSQEEDTAANKEMPEPVVDVAVPEGGYPVVDTDGGL